jgi:hypothetical protein
VGWIIGIDEAGYGPNLGPFVMSSVACSVPEGADNLDLWQALRACVRRGADKADGRLLVDDSKVVYSGPRGLAELERGVFALLGEALGPAPHLAGLLERLCPEAPEELKGEAWYTGASTLPVGGAALDGLCERLQCECAAAGAGGWLARSVVVCPPRFNALLDAHGSKGAVLADAFGRLLRAKLERAEGDLRFFVDKQGGRNAYAGQVQDALGAGMVVALEEGALRSSYRVLGLGRDIRLTFQPRADAEQFCVALASMVSKYVRELLMGELNAFWQGHVPGLRPTAGYPGDAARYLAAIRPAAQRLGIPEAAIWRRK